MLLRGSAHPHFRGEEAAWNARPGGARGNVSPAPTPASLVECKESGNPLKFPVTHGVGFPSGTVVENPPVNAGDVGLIPGPGRSPGGGIGNPLQYSCLGNPMDRGARCARVHGVAVGRDLVTQQQIFEF